MENATLVTVAVFSNILEGQLAKGRLESEGIACHLANENIVRMNPFYLNATGGLQLQVDSRELERARELLSPMPEDPAAEKSAVPVCPSCGRGDVERRRHVRLWAALAWLLVFVPVSPDQLRWHCKACGNAWKQ